METQLPEKGTGTENYPMREGVGREGRCNINGCPWGRGKPKNEERKKVMAVDKTAIVISSPRGCCVLALDMPSFLA